MHAQSPVSGPHGEGYSAGIRRSLVHAGAQATDLERNLLPGDVFKGKRNTSERMEWKQHAIGGDHEVLYKRF